MLQDETGFITLIYRQPLGLLETLFGLFRANNLVGKQGTVSGWFRRGPMPFLEIQQVQFSAGDQVNCYYRQFLWVFAAIVTIIGAVLMFAPI